MSVNKIVVALFIAATAIGCSKPPSTAKPVAGAVKEVTKIDESCRVGNLTSPACLKQEASLKATCEADRGTLQEQRSCKMWQERVAAHASSAIDQAKQANAVRLETVRTVADLYKILDEVVTLKDAENAAKAQSLYVKETAAYAAAKYCPALATGQKAIFACPERPVPKKEVPTAKAKPRQPTIKCAVFNLSGNIIKSEVCPAS